MTISDLYQWAKSHGVADKELVITAICSDDYYNLEEEKFDKKNLRIFRDSVAIEISNEY